MTTTPDDLDDRIRALVGAFARSAPPPPAFPAARVADSVSQGGIDGPSDLDLDGWVDPPGRRRWWAAAAAATAAAVVAGGVVVITGDDSDGGSVQTGTTTEATTTDSSAPTSVAPSARISVEHEVVTYVQEAELTCAGEADTSTGPFDELTTESWGDDASERWRSTTTFPDGSTYSQITTGDPWYPEATWTQGELRQHALGCGADTLVFAPLVSWVDPLTESPVSPAGFRAVPGHHQGELVPGPAFDSLGRPAELWRSVVDGSAGDGEERAVHQVEEWFVDPATGRTLEETYEYSIEGVGVARSVATSVVRDRVEVPADHFDVAGYSRYVDTWWGDPPVVAEAVPGDPELELGERWAWPPEPWPGSPEELGLAYAAAIGWTGATIDVVDTGPLGIEITGPDDRSIRLSAMRRDDGIVVFGVNGAVSSWGIGPGATFGMRSQSGWSASSADVFVRVAGVTTAWRVALPAGTSSFVVPVPWADVESVLVVLRDDASVAIDVSAYVAADMVDGLG